MERRLFLTAGLVLAACNRREVGPPIKLRMGVAGADLIHNLPLTLADKLGFYEEEGLELAIEELPFGGDVVGTVTESKADVASHYYSIVLQSCAEGRNLKAFINLLRFPGLVLVGSPKSKRSLRRIQDLEGVSVGVIEADTASQFLVNYLIGKRNLKRESIQIRRFTRAQTMVEALTSGNVDAAVAAEPVPAQLQRNAAKVPVLLDTRTPEGVEEAYGISQYPGPVVYAAADWVESNQEACLRLARVFRRTLAWIGSHTASQIAEQMPVEYRQPDPSLYVDALVSTIPMFSGNAAMPADSAEMVLRVLEYTRPELKQARVDLKATFTNEFVERAGQEGS